MTINIIFVFTSDTYVMNPNDFDWPCVTCSL